MDKEIKSLCYAFISRNIEIYIPDENKNVFIASKLICKNCKKPWYTSLQECFFCGEINYYVYICSSCKSYFSLTASNFKKKDIKEGKDRCPKCKTKGKIGQFCINENCFSNKDSEIYAKVKESGGIFMKESPFSLSLMHCINCGSPSNFYKAYTIAVKIVENSQICINKTEINSLFASDIEFLIIKIIENNEIKYDIKTKEDLKESEIKVKGQFENVDDLINFIFFNEE